MKMCKNKWVFAHRIPPGLPKSSQLRFKILSFTFKFQTDSSKIQILFSIFKIPTSRALASKVQGFSIQGFSIQGLSNQRIQRIERMGAEAMLVGSLVDRSPGGCSCRCGNCIETCTEISKTRFSLMTCVNFQ